MANRLTLLREIIAATVRIIGKLNIICGKIQFLNFTIGAYIRVVLLSYKPLNMLTEAKRERKFTGIYRIYLSTIYGPTQDESKFVHTLFTV